MSAHYVPVDEETATEAARLALELVQPLLRGCPVHSSPDGGCHACARDIGVYATADTIALLALELRLVRAVRDDLAELLQAVNARAAHAVTAAMAERDGATADGSS